LALTPDSWFSTKLAKARALALACSFVGNTAHRSSGGRPLHGLKSLADHVSTDLGD